MNIENVNRKFNEELQRQIEGSLPSNHTYQLGIPSAALLSAKIPNLPIELRSSRLNDKSMQENHPFDMHEIIDLPKAIQSPLAVFRSATHIGSFVIMTELKHNEKNYVVALETNRKQEKIEVNSIRSVYPKNNGQVANWIDEGLMDYVDKKKLTEWLSKPQSNSADVGKSFGQRFNSSKPQYHSADVRKLFKRATKIVQSFENTKL
jgi:hypothetical protein